MSGTDLPAAPIVPSSWRLLQIPTSTMKSIPQEFLQCSKESLLLKQGGISNPSGYMDEAVRMSQEMVKMETRFPGDKETAMRRLSVRHRLPPTLLWNLEYRRPKGIYWDVYENLRAAYRSECSRHARALDEKVSTA